MKYAIFLAVVLVSFFFLLGSGLMTHKIKQHQNQRFLQRS